MADNLPGTYNDPDVPFTRLTLAPATITNAAHALQKHAYDSPAKESVTYFPKGFFGDGDNDVYEVMRKMDLVTYYNEPLWNERTQSWMFKDEIFGVRVVVPVAETVEGSQIYESRTIWPEGGRGVRVYRGGRYYEIP